MAQSDLNVSNLALGLIGAKKITTLADTTKEALACTAHVDDCKKALLRMHPWNFAVKRKNISASYTAITSIADNGSGLYQITKATHGLSDGERVTIHEADSFSGANGTWILENTTTNTFDLKGSTYATDGGTDYGEYTTAPAFDYAYSIALPSDCLRVLSVNNDLVEDLYRIEGGRLLIDDDEDVEIKYIKDVTDYATMDALFYQALGHYLAYTLCDHITAGDGKKNEIHTYLYGGQGKRGILPQARFVDATEDAIQTIGATDWVASRVTN